MEDRIARIHTDLPDVTSDSGELMDALLFAHLTGADYVSRCFKFNVRAESIDPNIDATDLLGNPVTVEVTPDPEFPEAVRHFHGIVDEFIFEGNDDKDLFQYRLILRPALWQLSKQTDNRIFQELSVPDIISTVLDENSITDYRFDLSGASTPRTYCVQFGETTLDFLQRLMEHEGIRYFFEFSDGGHILVMTNKTPSDPDRDIRFEPNDLVTTVGEGVISRLSRTDSVVTASHTVNDYNFETPSANLIYRSDDGATHRWDDKERYSYPDSFLETGTTPETADLRLDENRSARQRIFARSNALDVWSGKVIELFDYPRDAENQEYLLLGAEYDIRDDQYSAGGGGKTDAGFVTQLQMFPLSGAREFRPPRITPKPVMKGPQTARVVGPSGEEIYTDQYARVKVQFFWDRLGEWNGESTCWIRVSAAWAGAGWGFIQIPRIGQEVIVDFLDGDPDRPIITGRVYNAEQMPPYDLPANATQSGWKSNSSKGGGGWNELRFEDLKGSEEVYFQAEKDHNELIKNNETRHIGNDFAENVVNNAKQDVGVNRDETVGNNKTTQVGVDRTVDIGSNDTETVGIDRSLTVGANETISVGVNSTETIGANHSQSVGLNQTIAVTVARIDTVGTVETRSVGAAQVNTIGATRQMTVGATQTHEIGATDTWKIGAGQSVEVAADQATEVGANHSLKVAGNSAHAIGKDLSFTVGENMNVEVGKDLVVKAVDSITFTCGDAKFQMKKDGTIVLEGKDLTIKGSGKINVKASSDVTMKGSKINMN